MGGRIISKAVPGSGEICLADKRSMSEGPHLYTHSMPACPPGHHSSGRKNHSGNNYTKGKSKIEASHLCRH